MRRCAIAWICLLTAASVVRADGPPVPPPGPPLSINFHSQFVKTDRDDAARRAIDALVNKEKLAAAEVLPDGNVLGWGDKATALVLIQPFRDGVHVAIVVGGFDHPEAGRLRIALSGHLAAGGAPADTPRSVRPDGVKKPPVAIKHGSDARNATPILRFFQPAGFIVLEKHGLAPADGGMPNTPLAFGGGTNRMAVTFALPGPNEISARVYAVVVAADDDMADALQRAIRQDVLKVLFE